MTATLCTNTGCGEDCFDRCAQGSCGVERKHFRRGGVCCLSCCSTCFDCGDTFYWEGLRHMPDEEPDEEGDLVEVDLCHCCLLRRDNGRIPTGPPTE